ncbi:MAG: polysaccharide lyase [Gammaproteobacteria bacterium]
MTACTSSTAASGPGNCAQAQSTSDVVFCQDFDGSALGDWNLNDLQNDFPGTKGNIAGPTGAREGLKEPSRTTIVSGVDAVSGNSLRAKFSANRLGPATGVQFRAPIGENLEEAYIGYWVRFDPSFPKIRGGKLPGLTGGTTDAGQTPCCGRPMKKGLGFSTRLMFVTGQRFVNYFYWIDNPRAPIEGKIYGGGSARNNAYTWIPGKWYFIEEHVKLNSPAGAANGLFEVWINGTKTTTIANTRIRGPGARFSISHILLHTYLGGSDPSWWSPKDTYNFFDVVVVSRSRIGGPGGG